MDRQEYKAQRLAEIDRDYRATIAPFIKAKIDAMAVMIPVFYITGDKFERVYSDRDQEILNGYDKIIKETQEYLTKTYNKIILRDRLR